MTDVRLVAPRVLVVRDGTEPMEIQTDNRDLVGWEQTRLRKKPPWPKFDEAPFKWLTFISWSAARRAGQVDTNLTFEAWEQSVLSVRDVGSSEEDDELGNPTQEEPGPD